MHLTFIHRKWHDLTSKFLKEKPSIVYYWTEKPNFGDMLNHDLLNYMGCKHLGPKQIRVYRPINAEGTAIGSILQLLLRTRKKLAVNPRPIKIFGSGFISPAKEEDERFLRPLDIYALRGKLSKERCERIMSQSLDHVVLGDPGLMVKRIFAPIIPDPQYDVGIVYHYVDSDKKPFHEKIQLQSKTFRLIDIRQQPSDFVKEVAQCKFILSSAMHPLICADSLGIPNCHIIVGDEVAGGSYKFLDYYSVFPQYKYQPIDLRTPGLIVDDHTIDILTDQYSITSKQVDEICDSLESVFPFPHKKENKRA